MIEMGIGIVLGYLASVTFGWWIDRLDRVAMRKLRRDVDYLNCNLLCGQGIFGCKAGPRCDCDHK